MDKPSLTFGHGCVLDIEVGVLHKFWWCDMDTTQCKQKRANFKMLWMHRLMLSNLDPYVNRHLCLKLTVTFCSTLQHFVQYYITWTWTWYVSHNGVLIKWMNITYSLTANICHSFILMYLFSMSFRIRLKCQLVCINVLSIDPWPSSYCSKALPLTNKSYISNWISILLRRYFHNGKVA